MTAAPARIDVSSFPPARRRQLRGQIVLFGALIALAVVLLARGYEFYALDLGRRVDHPDFRTLSPSSPIGHGYGVFGTALILTNLLYLARRRFARWRLGSMTMWLHIHVCTGLFGSVLVLFHSAFQLRSAIAALTAIALALVVVSGLVGRYFYSLTPQSSVRELDADLLVLDVFADRAGERLGLLLAALPPPAQPARAGLVASLRTLPVWMRDARHRRRLVREQCAGLLDDPSRTRAERSHLRGTVRRLVRLGQDPVRSTAGASLLRSWRGLHRFMALLMIVSVSVHITVAWVFGFRWILSE